MVTFLACVSARSLRRFAALSALFVAVAVPGQPSGPLPLRNLQVELRQVEMLSQAPSGVPGAGARVIGSVSSANAPAGAVVYRTLPEEASVSRLQGTQRLTVLNGRSASLRLSRAMLLQWVQPAWQSDGTVALLPGAAWAEAVGGVSVRPRWPGGGAPVQLELAAESAELPVDPTTGAPGLQLHTTVSVPLDQWTPVAAVIEGHAPVHPAAGTLDSRDARPVRRTVLQVRVSAP